MKTVIGTALIADRRTRKITNVEIELNSLLEKAEEIQSVYQTWSELKNQTFVYKPKQIGVWL